MSLFNKFSKKNKTKAKGLTKPFVHEFQKKKWITLRKRIKKNIVLWFLFGGIVAAGLTFGSLVLFCSPKRDVYAIKINETNVKKYLKDANQDVWVSQTESKKIGHKLLDLKALSDENKDITNFVISGTIDFGFLIDPNMDCSLSGINNATVNCSTNSNIVGCGIIIGRIAKDDKSGKNDGIYTKNLTINNNITFNISSENSTSPIYGIYFNNTNATSTQHISAIFNINSSTSPCTGLSYINADGNIVFDGNLTINSTKLSTGLTFNRHNGITIINGVLNITSLNDISRGISFQNESNGTTFLDGLIMVNSNSNDASCVRFLSETYEKLIINGTLITHARTKGYGLYYGVLNQISQLVMNGIIMVSTYSGQAFGIYFTLNNGTITVSGLISVYAQNASCIGFGSLLSQTTVCLGYTSHVTFTSSSQLMVYTSSTDEADLFHINDYNGSVITTGGTFLVSSTGTSYGFHYNYTGLQNNWGAVFFDADNLFVFGGATNYNFSSKHFTFNEVNNLPPSVILHKMETYNQGAVVNNALDSEYVNTHDDPKINTSIKSCRENENFSIAYYDGKTSGDTYSIDTKELVSAWLNTYASTKYCNSLVKSWIQDIVSQM